MAGTETRKTGDPHHSKVFYRPIEAAIRWSRLTRFELRILDTLGARPIPDPGDFPRWPTLRLNTERIFDAIRNGDLPYGKAGITCDDPSLIDDPDLTVRHVDLKTWMSRFYPDQRPAFLFDAIERRLHPAVSIETVQTLLAEQEALRIRLADREQSFSTLHEQHELLCRQAESWDSAGREVTTPERNDLSQYRWRAADLAARQVTGRQALLVVRDDGFRHQRIACPLRRPARNQRAHSMGKILCGKAASGR
jgi:hypothetical protein